MTVKAVYNEPVLSLRYEDVLVLVDVMVSIYQL